VNRTHRVFFSGLAAVCLVLTSIGPSFAQSAPSVGSWLAGPDGAGSSTIVGRIESPRAGQRVNPGANVLVSGWAADVTAQGWAGIDGVEVWSGAKDKGGTKLASGSVGLARADIGEALGNFFTNSGFVAVVPGSAWTGMTAGTQTLYVYLHTPGKGTWYHAIGVNLQAPLTLAFPNDPIVWIAKPQEGMNITQKQVNSKFTFSGIALDRNTLDSVAGNLAMLPAGFGQTLGPGCSGCGLFGSQARGAGINTTTAWIDHLPAKGEQTFVNFGVPAAFGYGTVLVSGKGSLNTPGKPQGSIISRQYGSQFDYSGWSISINPTLLAPGPHTLYVTAQSSITGKTSTASVDFNIIGFVPGQRIQP
jgi:hypothetical protein